MPEANDLSLSADAALSPVEQAAIVLLSMGEEPAAAVLRCLSEDLADRPTAAELVVALSRARVRAA